MLKPEFYFQHSSNDIDFQIGIVIIVNEQRFIAVCKHTSYPKNSLNKKAPCKYTVLHNFYCYLFSIVLLLYMS